MKRAMTKRSATAKRVARSRQRMRKKGLRLVQFWVPDTRAPGFAEELARQCRAEADWQATPEGREEMVFWNEIAAEAWADLK